MSEQKTEEKKPQNLQEEIVDATKKKMLSSFAKQGAARVEAGEDPKKVLNDLINSLQPQQNQQDLLSQVQQLSQARQPTGERLGLIPSLLRGHGFSRPNITEPIGMGTAMQLMNLQQQIEQSQRKIPQERMDLLEGMLDFYKKSGNREAFEALSGLLNQTKQGMPQDTFETDPFTGELTPAALERKQRITTRATQEEQAQVKQAEEKVKIRRNFNTTASLFKRLIAQLRGGIEEGGAGGLMEGFKGDLARLLKVEGFGRTSAIPGQRAETSLALNRILTGQNRVIRGVVQMIKGTLPTSKDPEDFIASKVEQSIRNAYGIMKAFDKAGLTPDVLNNMSQKQLDAIDVPNLVGSMTLTPDEQTEIEAIVQDVLSAPPTKPRKLGTFKAGDTRNVNGINYTRGEDGIWRAQ